MKVLVDECVPLKLVRLLTGHEFTTAQEKGWGSFNNGRLLALAEPAFDLFLASDRNIGGVHFKSLFLLANEKAQPPPLGRKHLPTRRWNDGMIGANAARVPE